MASKGLLTNTSRCMGILKRHTPRQGSELRPRVLLCRALFQVPLRFSSLLQLQLSSPTALLWVNPKRKLLHAPHPKMNYWQQRCLYPNWPVCSTWSFSVQTCCSPLVSPHPLLPSPTSSPTAGRDGRMRNTIFTRTHASPAPPAHNSHRPFRVCQVCQVHGQAPRSPSHVRRGPQLSLRPCLARRSHPICTVRAHSSRLAPSLVRIRMSALHGSSMKQ